MRRRAAAWRFVVGLGVAVGGHGFEREFGIDDQRPFVGQEDRAVGPQLVGERVLEFVAALGQAVAHDQFHAALAEGAALLLVGKHALQRGDLGRQRRDVLLRAVDDGEPLVELLQVFRRAQLGLFERIAEPVRHRIEPLVDGMAEMVLRLGEQADHGLEPRRRVGLRPRQVGHGRHRSAVAAAARAGWRVRHTMIAIATSAAQATRMAAAAMIGRLSLMRLASTRFGRLGEERR